MSASITHHYCQPSLLPAVDKGTLHSPSSKVTEDSPPGKHIQCWHMKPLPLCQWLWLGKCHHGSHSTVQLLVESHSPSSANQLQAIGNDMSHRCRKQHSISWAHSRAFSSTKHHKSWAFAIKVTRGQGSRKSPKPKVLRRFSWQLHKYYVKWKEKNTTQKHSACSRFWGSFTEFYDLSPCPCINSQLNTKTTGINPALSMLRIKDYTH